MIKEFFKNASENGLRLPFAFDPVKNAPSVTLFFMYLAGLLVLISLVLLHINDKFVVATSATIIFWILTTVFYLIRTIARAKIDLDDKSLELESGEEKGE